MSLHEYVGQQRSGWPSPPLCACWVSRATFLLGLQVGLGGRKDGLGSPPQHPVVREMLGPGTVRTGRSLSLSLEDSSYANGGPCAGSHQRRRSQRSAVASRLGHAVPAVVSA